MSDTTLFGFAGWGGSGCWLAIIIVIIWAISAFAVADSIKPVPAGFRFIFIVGIMEAVGSMTSIYMIRSDSGAYISITFGSSTGLGSGDIVAKGV